MSNHGKIWWNELMTRDVEKAKAYYSDLCGWSFDSMPDPDTGSVYWIAMQGDQPVGGLMDMSLLENLNGVPPHWFTYIAVDDVDASVEATTAAGGEIRRPAFDVPGIGRIAIIADPTGAPVGIMTPAAPAEQG
ncbi:VOC family protein [Tropicibacter sp. R15_0]|uniref:VOC family protein n=1 Tax=Tropicibacter sp. R15_0 TaxID=2821101 RepID=UPI001ADD39BF|nr:VOC family protein [Tropicibacter sp. R15_0]MBO9465502.1 VOC family protein [Tropicibacter sp. R15_0]